MFESLKLLNRYRNNKVKKIKMMFKTAKLNRQKKVKNLFNIDECNSILIVMCDYGIGDAIVASFLIYELRKNNYNVSVVVDERLNFLFDYFIQVDNAFFFNKKNIKKFIRAEEKIKIDLAIDLYDEGNNSLRRVEIISSFKPTHTLGFNQSMYRQYDTSICYSDYDAHITERSCIALDFLNIDYDMVKYHLNIQYDELQLAKKFLDKICDGLDKFIIVFNPFGSSKTKSLSFEQIEKITEFLTLQKDCITIVVGEQKEIVFIHELPNVYINKNPSFIFTSALVSLCNLVITVDTSIVHVASAYNIPMIAVYNNRYNLCFDLNKVWAPISNNFELVFTKENKGTEFGDPVSNLDIQFIIEKIKKMLSVNFKY
ncbi:MAG: glycosyltransferase family 9 protein [Gilliamella sp.]|uniref:glycosyltransferase family 9 protein n=1 Tax=Gilliamella sp. TaxID=1891236 RepID=UPI0025E1DAAC|nr:glycosyltransferase family 9 protein [Gilliamella sp.]MCO6539468.1 glycosyltransferase family 9 protein [Gilliamella sp.]